MDKSKIIDEILAEWAMRSPDGLVGGHDTPENMAVLNEILTEKGVMTPQEKIGVLSAEDEKSINPLDLKYWEVRKGKILPKKDHPTLSTYSLNDEYLDMARNADKMKKFNPNVKAATPEEIDTFLKTQPNKEYSEPEWSIGYLEKIKGFNTPSATSIFNAINEIKSPTLRKAFDDKFDKSTPEEAITFLNTNYSKYSDFIAAVDASRKTKGKDGDKKTQGEAKAGRGEYILVLLIEGARTAGQESGDIKLSNGTSMEVKEVDGRGEIWRATRSSFGGGSYFNRIPFVEAINELVAFCNQSQEHIDALMELAKEAEIKDGQGTKGTRHELTGLQNFFEAGDINGINVSATYGLQKLGAYIRKVNAAEAKAKIMAPDKVEFDVKNQTNILKVTDVDPNLIDKVQNPPEKPETITITVSSIEKEKKKAELIVPRIKRLKFFKYEPTSMDDVYTSKNIAKSMFAAMSKPPGHYTGGIVFYNSDKFKFTYEKNIENLDYYFYGFQQMIPAFTKKAPTETEKAPTE